MGIPDPKVSKEEGYYYEWLLELQSRGYIEKIILQPEFNLTETVDLPFKIEKVTGRGSNKKLDIIDKYYTIMRPMKYTPDFNVYWTKKALGVFVFVEGALVDKSFMNLRKTMLLGHIDLIEDSDLIYTCIEVKGTFVSKNNSTDVKFPLLLKMMYDKYNIYVNKVMPFHKQKGVFCNTFTPKAYWVTDVTKKERKLAWDLVSVDDYISSSS